jgi:PASTA domain
MTRILRQLFFLLLLLALTVPGATLAQGDSVGVPDLTGLSVPEAAARLNRNGIELGAETAVSWTESSGLPRNRISSQSVPAGQQVLRGTTVNVTVMRLTNVLLLYDYNMLTLVNKTGFKLDLSDITFDAQAASVWPPKQLENGQCAQIWAISRSGPQGAPECTSIQTWLFTTNAALQFWRRTEGGTQFAFAASGVRYGACDAAAPDSGPMRCGIYLAESAQDDVTDYIYFAYTAEQLVIRNKTKDEWMPLDGVILVNNLPAVKGQTFAVGDAKGYPIRAPVGRVNQLAPGQCLWFTNSNPQLTSPPQPCDVIARLDVNPSLIFWASDFGVDGALDDKPHTCPRATPGKLTICAMPR